MKSGNTKPSSFYIPTSACLTNKFTIKLCQRNQAGAHTPLKPSSTKLLFLGKQIGKSHPSQMIAQLLLGRAPYPMHCTNPAVAAGTWPDHAIIEGYLANDRLDHLKHSDPVGIGQQTIPAGGALQDFDNSLMGQLLRDLGQKLAGNIRLGGYLFPAHQRSATTTGKIQNAPHRIFTSSCQSHPAPPPRNKIIKIYFVLYQDVRWPVKNISQDFIKKRKLQPSPNGPNHKPAPQSSLHPASNESNADRHKEP